MSGARIAGPAGALAVDDGGRGGVPVVFVHSLAGCIAHWSGQLAHLRPDRRAVALDLRGHGRSAPPSEPRFTVEDLAADVAALVDALALRRFALVGHSLGGGVALAYAGMHPDRVERLLLADAIGDGTRLPPEEMEPFLAALESRYVETIEGYWTTVAGPEPEIRERLLRDLRATPREVVVAGLRAVARFDPKPALARFRGPALAVITPANNYPYSLHRLGAGLPHRVIEGTGHWLQLDKADEFNGILDGFLRATA